MQGTLIVDKREPEKMRKLADRVEDILADCVVLGETSFVCERKTPGDMWGSLKDGRFWKQLARIREMAQEIDGYPVLIVDGKPYTAIKNSNLTLARYYGLIVGAAKTGIIVVQVPNDNHLKVLMDTLKRQAGRPPSTPREVRVTRKTILSDYEQALAMLQGVTGVGGSKSRKLLEKYGSVSNVIGLDVSTLKRELGEKTGEQFYRVVHTDYRRKHQGSQGER